MMALDRVEAVQTASVSLFLPRGRRARVRVSDAAGAVLRTATVTAAR